MKILHVINSCDPKNGGPIEGIKQFNKFYKKYKIQAHILCSDNKNDNWLKDKRLPKVYAVGPKILNYGYNPKMKAWLIKNIQKYDVIIINGIWQYHNYAVWKVAKFFNVPYFIFLHGMLDPWFNQKYFFKHIKKIIYWKLIQYRILKDSESVLYTSEDEKKLARKSFVPFNFKEKVIGYGIEGNKYKTLKKNNVFFKKFPKLRNKKIILFFGRINEKKGVDILIKSFASVLQKEKGFHLVIVGPYQESYYKKLNKIIITNNLFDKVTWTGDIYGKLKWHAYSACDVFCLPSHQENFGISVVEALSSKKFVLITNKINIYKKIKNSFSGIITQNNLKSFSNGLKKYLNLNKLEYKKYSNNAYKCFIKNYKIEPVVINFLKYIKNNLIKNIKI